MKTEKSICFFVFQKYDKFKRVSLDHFIKHKSFISEECSRRNIYLGKKYVFQNSCKKRHKHGLSEALK